MAINPDPDSDLQPSDQQPQPQGDMASALALMSDTSREDVPDYRSQRSVELTHRDHVRPTDRAHQRDAGPLYRYTPDRVPGRSLHGQPSSQVIDAIQQAAKTISFNVIGEPGDTPEQSRARALFKMAHQESGFNDLADNGTARGLFQFTKGTWNTTMLELRHEGLISQDTNTDYASGAWKDPKLNALAGAQYAKDNSIKLEKMLGQAPRVDQIYGAHWMGDAGYSAIMHSAPGTSMKDVLGRFYSGDVLESALKNNALRGATVADFHNMSARFMSTNVDAFLPGNSLTPAQTIPVAHNAQRFPGVLAVNATSVLLVPDNPSPYPGNRHAEIKIDAAARWSATEPVSQAPSPANAKPKKDAWAEGSVGKTGTVAAANKLTNIFPVPAPSSFT